MSDKKKNVFSDFLKNNTVMVVDKSSASRRRLTKTLVDMGCSRQRVHSVAHFTEAVDIIEREKPQLVLSDYAINGGSGFDLFREYRSKLPDEKKATLILITSNISQSAVAKAAEEDVDAFIIKPYTVKSLEKNLISAVYNKLYPSDYIQKIDLGKQLMFNGHYSEAYDTFTAALELSKKPALALFYQGQAKYFMELMDEASTSYKKGLTFNNIHFKCQVGLYELLIKRQDYDEAYAVVRNIAKYFPSNPDRLKEVIHLAMRTKNYPDIDQYYEIFVELEERTPDVVDYVCAGLYICGKYFMQVGDKGKAKDLYDKAGVACMGSAKFLSAMIKVLYENECHFESRKLLPRFDSKSYESREYEVAAFLAEVDIMDNTDRMKKGVDVYNKGYKDFYVLSEVVKAMKSEGQSKRAEEYEEEIARLWPEKALTQNPLTKKQAA